MIVKTVNSTPITSRWCSLKIKTSFLHCCSNVSFIKHVRLRLHIALQKYASLKYAHFKMRDMVPFCKSGHIYYLTSVFVCGCIKAVNVTTCNYCINNINSQKRRWNCKKFRTLPGTHRIKFLIIIVIASKPPDQRKY